MSICIKGYSSGYGTFGVLGFRALDRFLQLSVHYGLSVSRHTFSSFLKRARWFKHFFIAYIFL